MTKSTQSAPCIVCGTEGGYVRPGSDRPERVRRACTSCYDRHKYLGRLGDLERVNEEIRPFLDTLLAGDVDPDDSGCIIWPYAVNRGGYPFVTVDTEQRRVAHLVLEASGHPRPSAEHEAAHAPASVCGSRACVHVEHLRWATRTENEADKATDGTVARGARHGMSKISAQEARDIRDLYLAGEHTNQAIGDRYGVSPSLVSAIGRGEKWAHLSNRSNA